MKLIHQLVHIYKTFGMAHAFMRVRQALRAKLNELARDIQHRNRVKSLENKESIVINCLGKDFELKTNDFGLYRDLISDRIREPVATSLMLKYTKPDFVVLDAGANIGYFSLLLADRCRELYAVEPDIDNFNALNENIQRNLIGNIKTFNLAFSDKRETLKLNRSTKANWHTTSKTPDGSGDCVVNAMEIDEFCKLHNFVPDIIKMDIEGFERFVIPGAKATLPSVKYLFFELHSSHMSINEVNVLLDIIEEAGLKIQNIIRYDRPGLWLEESTTVISNIKKGDFGIYELIYSR